MPQIAPITLEAIKIIEQLAGRMLTVLSRNSDKQHAEHMAVVANSLEFCRQTRGRKKKKWGMK